MTRVLVIGDSLAFHGPNRPEPVTEPRLYPNVMARALGSEVDVLAELGWTARSAWWALTKSPYVYSALVPHADAVVLAVGNTDQLPASLPTYLRDGIAYLRPGWVRRPVRQAHHRAHPYVVRALDGRLRVLGQPATDAYLTRCVRGLRQLWPGKPVVGMVPPPYDAGYHGHVSRPHAGAADAARGWAARERVPVVDADAIIAPYLAAGRMNPDGMHWDWDGHRAVGEAFADLIAPLLAGSGTMEAR
jgi:lysophospholipase L1-like esterase